MSRMPPAANTDWLTPLPLTSALVPLPVSPRPEYQPEHEAGVHAAGAAPAALTGPLIAAGRSAAIVSDGAASHESASATRIALAIEDAVTALVNQVRITRCRSHRRTRSAGGCRFGSRRECRDLLQ